MFLAEAKRDLQNPFIISPLLVGVSFTLSGNTIDAQLYD